MGYRLLILSLVFMLSNTCRAESVTPDHTQADYDFFETSVRPLLLNACGKCHGPTTHWAGLRTDSLDALLKGGDTGPAIVPGQVEESLMIASVRRTGDYDMPPDDPLTADQVAILEQWIRMGAPWPAGEHDGSDRTELHQNHWAFQPISQPVPPKAIEPLEAKTPVDQFLQAKLNSAGLKASPTADRATLIRRLSYDLTGLPPSYQDVQIFCNDPAEDAYEQLVERLLASSAYGEHQARAWLDLARFADTKGYVYGREERRFVHSWNYRDWVIKAMNDDLPYDQFLLYQIAADQYSPDDEAAQAAMGFITVGRRFLGNLHDVFDDRIDVLGRTTMGLTISCARCHDHKYDPIPTADYYSLYGVFQNCSDVLTPLNSEILDNDQDEVVVELKKRIQALQEQTHERQTAASKRVRDRFADYLFAQTELDKYPDVNFSQIFTVDDILPSFVFQFSQTLNVANKHNDPVFLIWNRLAALPQENFEVQAQATLDQLRQLPPGSVHPFVLKRFEDTPNSMRDVADRYGTLLKEIDDEWIALEKQAADQSEPPPQVLPDENKETLRNVLYGKTSPCMFPEEGVNGTEFFYDLGTTVHLWQYQSAVDAWIIQHGEKLPFTVRLVDRENLVEPRIFRRGNSSNKGDEITRHFPTVITGPDSAPFTQGSGRLELAQGIVSPSNPLTARVWVNRIWQHHFGVGLVPTSSDFGTRAAEPVQLELLDWLAQELIQNGWSTKHIHRLILLSNAYQQVSSGPVSQADYEHAITVDPENRLIWKANIHRLTFEELRDSMLKVAGQLDRQAGGPASPMFDGDGHRRRSIYGYVDRQFLPNVFRVFDFANPDLHIPTRAETTVSQQALYGLNNPFIAARTENLEELVTTGNSEINAERTKDANDASEGIETEVVELFRAIYQRDPTAQQLQLAIDYLRRSDPAEEQTPTASTADQWTYGYGEVTESGLNYDSYKPLPYFTGSAWQGGAEWPHVELGWAQLNAQGGHPGVNGFSVVRRWTPDVSGKFQIDSSTNHEPEQGNGIRCWIISSTRGVLKTFHVHHATHIEKIADLEVQAGETIDFVTDMNGDLGYDQFLWSVEINRSVPVSGANSRWSSADDFSKGTFKELTPWQQLAQVLLLSNEFVFVD